MDMLAKLSTRLWFWMVCSVALVFVQICLLAGLRLFIDDGLFSLFLNIVILIALCGGISLLLRRIYISGYFETFWAMAAYAYAGGSFLCLYLVQGGWLQLLVGGALLLVSACHGMRMLDLPRRDKQTDTTDA